VLIPAYNEQEGIAATIASVSKELTLLSVYYEILVVEDGSRDQPSVIVEQLVSADTRIRLVRHSQNMGIGAGIKTGIAEARGQFMNFVPADLAMDVKQIYRYVDASARADIVLGNRTNWCDYMGAKWPTVVQAAAETWFFWLKWIYRTITRQRSRGYVNG